MSFKISFDIRCDVHNKTIYKATVSYFLIKKDNSIDKKSNYLCIKHEIKFHEIRLIPRPSKNANIKTSCWKNIEKSQQGLQIRKLLLKDDEILNDSNEDLEIVLSNDINSSYLNNFNKSFNETNQTINNAYKFIMGVNPSGHKTQRQFSSNVLIDINDESSADYIFNNCTFIQFFTYILGDNNNKKSSWQFNEHEFNEINLYDFLNNNLDPFFYQIFLLSNIKHKYEDNKNNIDKNLKNIFESLNNKYHYFKKEEYDDIENNFDWSKWTLNSLKDRLISQLIDLNKKINNNSMNKVNNKLFDTREVLLEELEITSRRYITNQIAYNKDIQFDYVYLTFRKELSCVENCHIFNVKDAKKCFKEDDDMNNWWFYLNSMSDISNILLLPSNLHSLFDANILKINFINNDYSNLQFIQNDNNIISLTQQESNFLKIKDVNIWSHITKVHSLNLNNMKKYILKRSELIQASMK